MGTGAGGGGASSAAGHHTLKDRLLGGRLRRLRSLVEIDVGLDLVDEDDLAGLLGGRAGSELLLGTFTPQEIEDAFVRNGITERLTAQGLAPLRLRIDARDPFRHTLQVFTEADELLAESSLRVGQFTTEAEWAGALRGKRLSMLYALWLLMQNPRGAFTAARPALPGQDHPGLRVAHQVDQVFRRLAHRLECHGIINCPEFFHTAVFYSQAYHFLDPVTEGQLIALRRDLGSVPLAEASWAVLRGCVVEAAPAAAGSVFRWEPQEQLLPLHPRLASYFGSATYRDAVAGAAEDHRYHLDGERFAKLNPLRPDGTVAPEDRL